MTIPEARILRTTRTRKGGYLVYVDCPYCGKEHQHGVPKEDAHEERSHRKAHCDSLFISGKIVWRDNGAGYYLTPSVKRFDRCP